MSAAANYFQRQSLKARINEPPEDDCCSFIVIPIHNEDGVINCLQSLLNCTRANKSVEVILLFNSSIEDKEAIEANNRSVYQVNEWAESKELHFRLHIVEENAIDPKIAGVGVARKIGMDEALLRAQMIGKDDAWVVCLDADCTVSKNYLLEIERCYTESERMAMSFYYEHPLEGLEFPDSIYESIIYYELHLRYYKRAMEFVGLPFDRYTVGSSMAVRADEYAREGGMNKRKAGEDFYFLQKFLIKGKLSELNSLVVYPSPRISERVPFGTGRAILEHQQLKKNLKNSYSIHSFICLKSFIEDLERSYPQCPTLNAELSGFLTQDDWKSAWYGMKKQSKNWDQFWKRFIQWMTPFKVLKVTHHLRDNYFPDDLLVEQIEKLIGTVSVNPKDLLLSMRKYDKEEGPLAELIAINSGKTLS